MATKIEGLAEFHVPGLAKPCQTWYTVIGDLHTSAAPPLIVLHGGPGACHDYLLPLTDLGPSTAIVFYDQIGNGRSTHLPEKNGDENFWSVELFINELDNLLSHLGLQDRPIDVYGHSWGGMLAAEWAAAQPPNLRRLIISNSLASMDAWREGVNYLRQQLPAHDQKGLAHAEETLDFESSEYQDAVEVPTLLMNGVQDEAQDVAMQPFFDHLPGKVKWITLDNAAHFSHVDQRKVYMRHLGAFLAGS
ncbi:peptidase S33 [Diaporthe helianthi]|uniref:Peptidase S33 n=1 Tax=Diaporthe helianthi TaxID=158607 RepID=A0A2P5I4W1_DIAHE|nr:peptidase S33 [Diaporthe helianthi]